MFDKISQVVKTGSWKSVPEKPSFPLGIKRLYEPEECNFDIVFVHGLMGNREKTWTSGNASISWPQDLLPRQVPTARTLTFGYNAQAFGLLGNVSQSSTGNHAMKLLTAAATFRANDNTNDRPIIFVCHSLGGLVVEDVLVSSTRSPERHLRRILECTRGIFFLGIPYFGSDVAGWTNLVQKFAGRYMQVNRDLLNVLQSDSEVLARIQHDFHKMIRQRGADGRPVFEVPCFFEELKTSGVGLVVPRRSAVIAGYTAVGIHSDHRDMAKFEDEDDDGFKAVSGEIKRWMKSDPTGQNSDDLWSGSSEGPTRSRKFPLPSPASTFGPSRATTSSAHNAIYGSVASGSVGIVSGNISGGINLGGSR